MRNHLLHEPDAEGFGGVETVAGEDPAHGIAPADGAREAEGGAAEREDAAGHLDLPKTRRVGRDRNVAGEQ